MVHAIWSDFDAGDGAELFDVPTIIPKINRIASRPAPAASKQVMSRYLPRYILQYLRYILYLGR